MKTLPRPLLVWAATLALLTVPTFAGFQTIPVREQALTERVRKPVEVGPPLVAEVKTPKPAKETSYVVTVTNDFVVEAYKNGMQIPKESRELLLDRFGATAERINVSVAPGDWLVFQVAHNPIRWGGSKYFAVAGCTAPNQFTFVSDPTASQWTVCDDAARATAFIENRKSPGESSASAIENPWGEGDQFIREFAGSEFPGVALWGKGASTWIKYVAPGGEPTAQMAVKDKKVRKAGKKKRKQRQKMKAPEVRVELFAAKKAPEATPEIMQPKRFRVQVLSAIYGTGGKNADVLEKVREYVEQQQPFSANPIDLGADPNPTWNKGLHIVYMKDGVRREQHRNENERILPESFYGPQDVAELRAWLPASRWKGEQGEIQFHADGTFTSPGVEGTHRWEAPARGRLRLTRDGLPTVEFAFDYTWSSFSEVENGKNVFHVVR
ncbi:MAG: hypothetical protein ACO1QR_08550 [Chthoniobacteraceae bacterium]